MSSTSDLNCVFCEETFGDKESLQTHFRKHADPNFKQNKDKSGFQHAAAKSTEKPKEEIEMVSCDACEETFSTISKAITHKHKVHPDLDAKYFCPWCGKLFTLKHLYNKHLQTNHESNTIDGIKYYHCDSCNVDFYVPSAMLHHNKFFHRQETELPSIGQSKKQKVYDNELLTMYYCTFCGEEFNNKVNLFTHMSNDHNDENQSPDEVLRCPLCDAIFYHLDAFEVHLTFHSPEDIYTDFNDRNTDEISEYTVETVPPIMEKVEDLDPQCYAEKLGNATGIETFLQMSMNTESEAPEKKHKKHKKHKKSKKSAITLDEFLNMNKDVFGEGIDFQGIEEVPTRVITKQLKNKSLPHKTLKLSSSLDVEKLKKQGIVIKKSGMAPTVKKVSKNLVLSNTMTKNTNINTKPQAASDSSNEVLSKILNKSNNQLKITKRPTHENDDKKKKNVDETTDNSAVEINIDEEVNKIKKGTDDTELNYNLEEDKDFKANESNNKGNGSINQQNQKDLENQSNEKIEDMKNLITKEDTSYNFASTESNEIPTPNEISFSPSLKTINQQVTIRTVKQNSKICDDVDRCQNDNSIIKEKTNNTNSSPKGESDDDYIENSTENNKFQNKNDTPPPHNKSLNILKQLGHITVKSLKQDDKDNSDKQEDNISRNRIITDKKDDDVKQNLSQILPTPVQNSKYFNENVMVKSEPERTHENINSDNDSECDNEQEFDKNTDNDFKLQDNKIIHPVERNMSVNLQIKNAKPENKQYFDSKQAEISSSNINILNNLRNITAKPIKSNQNILQQKTGFKIPITTETCTKNVIDNDIEIFNVDDSDSEEEPRKSKPQINNNGNVNIKKVEHKKIFMKSENYIKQIGGNITIKSLSTNSLTEIKEHVEGTGCQSFKPTNLNEKFKNNQPKEENIVLQKVLKNLGNNVTIKSRTSSPSSTKSQDQSSQDDEYAEEEEYNINPMALKITEVTEDNCSDDDLPKELDNDNNVTVQYPSGSDSENDHEEFHHNDAEDEFKDDAVIKSNIPLKKELNAEILKHNRNLTSFNKKEENICSSPINKADFKIPNNLNKNLTIKSLKQVQNVNQFEQENLNEGEQSFIKDTLTNKSNMNVQVSAGNQVNTLNKAVTVKTFQSQTVIEEVTTTVTKTIRRVNQTVNQELGSNQSIGQQKSCNNLKIQNFPRPNFIRPTAPQQKVRNVMSSPVRAGTSLNISNQIVPVKQGLNIARNISPRMPSSKQIMPSTSYHQNPMTCKPLKISPQVINNSIKRPPSEENGPFSCFKKPKEPLIPSSEFPFDKEKKIGLTKQFVSTSQIQKSNVSSATNIVKGKSFVKSTQMKTETKSSHFNKTQSVSGVKIMQESSVTKVEHKSESNVSKRTLDTIEMLRRQGLLVKKPRMDLNNDSDNSNSSGETDNLEDDK